MIGFIIYILFITISITPAASSTTNNNNKYCQLNCDYGFKNFTHTVCERDKINCGPEPKCGPDFKPIKFSDYHRQYIVDLHNYLRNKVALGFEDRGGKQPPAANMKVMSYNKELEYIAQCWANTCNGSPLTHDTCRRTAQFKHVGQNLGFINSSIPTTETYTAIRELIMLWYNEVAIFKTEWIKDTQDRGANFKVGHYTQMLWAQTNEIGCALTYYTSGKETKWHHLVFVCNYGPGGNYLGLPIYQVGKSATKCEENLKQNRHYKGLCGDAKRVIVQKN